MSEPSLFRIDVGTMVNGEGLALWTASGEPVTVQGRPMVMLRHGACVPAGGFVATLAEAKRIAADEIDAVRARLAAQAARLREEAAT
jgi:hypothetical protein